MSHIVIPLSTAASTLEVPVQISGSRIPATLIARGLSAGEEVTVKFSVDGGQTWEDLYADGEQVKLTDTNKTLAFYSPILVGVQKPITAKNAGVFLSAVDNV